MDGCGARCARGELESDPNSVAWSGSLEASRQRLTFLHDEWRSIVTMTDLDTICPAPWPTPQPLSTIATWVNVELMKKSPNSVSSSVCTSTGPDVLLDRVGPRCLYSYDQGPVRPAPGLAVSAACQSRAVDTLSNQQIADAELVDWRKLAQALHARYRIPNYTVAAAFVVAVAQAAELVAHHPDLKLTPGVVDVSLCTRQDGLWVTQKDVDLARRISEIAQHHGLTSEPHAVTQLEIALDTAHEDGIGPFWSVLLSGSSENKIYDSVFDPTGRVPSVWFQSTDDHPAPRQRWHFDLWLAPEVAEERIAAAVAADGSVVYDAGAPSFTVLADPDGNRVCVCTSLGRD